MRNINRIIRLIYIFITIFFVIKNTINLNIFKIILSMFIVFLTFLPKFLNKNNEKLIFIYYIYILLLLIVGYLFDAYDKLEYYDLFVHFSIGIPTSLIALYILKLFGINNFKFSIIFIMFTTLSIASLWEVFEYIASIIIKSDIQDVLKTGIVDTIEDMVAAFLCSIFFAIYYWFNKNKIFSLFI